MKKIAVFCSARKEIDPQFNKVAREFVRAASLRGYGIVSGGTIKGTMGEISWCHSAFHGRVCLSGPFGGHMDRYHG